MHSHSLAGEYEDFWCFDPVKEVWTDLTSRVVRSPVEKAPRQATWNIICEASLDFGPGFGHFWVKAI